jgi:hypothetical protein
MAASSCLLMMLLLSTTTTFATPIIPYPIVPPPAWLLPYFVLAKGGFIWASKYCRIKETGSREYRIEFKNSLNIFFFV